MSLMKKAIGGSIHRIREFELEKVNLVDEFDILQIVGEGWFGKILLTEHRSTQTEMVLKALPKAYTGISDFFREFHYGLHLSAHRNIITTYDVAFETAGFYVFSQQYAPLGDLTSNVTETGLGELHAKRVARQLAAAVHHMHSRELVHRDIKLDNILVFRSDFSRIKLCDFGETRRVNTVVRRHNEWLPYSPPEVLQIDTDETYKALTSHDVWQFGIVLFVCLTGCLPWQKAALDDPRYTRYQNWHNATLNIAKKPKLFQLISSRAQRMFKRLLDPKPEKRPTSVLEMNKFVEDRWLGKLGAEKALNGGADERDELCPSMYSFHSSLEEKNQLLYTLTTYGIETTVDRSKKKDRIREWIESSAIVEENEDEESDLNEEKRLEACLEDENEEPISMKGRHFPERRPPSVPADGSIKKKKKKHSDAGHPRKRLPKGKSMETKNPFAPQVAAERETVARFASFPNCDPNLAVPPNQTNSRVEAPQALLERLPSVEGATKITRTDSTIEEVGPKVSANGQILRNSPGSSTNTSQDSSVFMIAANNCGTSSSGTDNIVPEEENRNGRIAPASPQAPTRKHRSQVPSFPVASSRGGRAEPVRSRTPARADSQSAIGGLTGEAENPPIQAETKPTSNTFAKRADIQAFNARGRMDSPPVTTLPPRLERSSPNATQSSSNNLNMSVATQLVMQSFNTLQDVNTAILPLQSALPASSSSSASNSTINLAPNIVSNSPSSVANLKTKVNSQNNDTTIMSYGKDAFEHYGIAQGVIFRTEPLRHRTSVNGTASRSVSN